MCTDDVAGILVSDVCCVSSCGECGGEWIKVGSCAHSLQRLLKVVWPWQSPSNLWSGAAVAGPLGFRSIPFFLGVCRALWARELELPPKQLRAFRCPRRT